MHYTQWSSSGSGTADAGYTNTETAGPTGSLTAFTSTEEDYEQTLRYRTAWAGGTSSASTQQATLYTEATAKATARDSDGNIESVGQTIDDDETSGLAPFGGGTTANTSYPVTYRPTQAATLRVTYATIGEGTNTTVLTGTAAATRESPVTITSTSSFSGLTTVRQFATGVSGLLFSNVKENPEFSGPNNSFYRNFGREAGEGTSAIGRRVAAAFSAQAVSGDQAYTQSISEGADVALSLPLTLSNANVALAGLIVANRKIFSVPATSDVIYLSTGTGTSFYTTSSANNSDLTAIPSLLVPMFRQGGFINNSNVGTNIMTPRIFTNVEKGFSIGSSSASACWSYQSSSWILYTTLANDSTQSDGSAEISFSGSAQTTTARATFELGSAGAVFGSFTVPNNGITHGLLGPAIPLTISGLHEISVTSINPNTNFSKFFARTQQCTSGLGQDASITSRTGVFATAVSSYGNSTSATTAMGSATGPRMVATYSHTVLTAAVPVPGVSIATRVLSSVIEISPGISSTQYTRQPVNVSAEKAGKWHEAGQANLVSVRGLPAARTAFV